MHWNWPTVHCDRSIFLHGFRSTLLHHKIAEFTVHHGITSWYILVFFNTLTVWCYLVLGLLYITASLLCIASFSYPRYTHISNGITVCTRYIYMQTDEMCFVHWVVCSIFVVVLYSGTWGVIPCSSTRCQSCIYRSFTIWLRWRQLNTYQ